MDFLRAFHAMVEEEPVVTEDGKHCGVIDELYRSVWEKSILRCRITTPGGLVHHADVKRVVLLVPEEPTCE